MVGLVRNPAHAAHVIEPPEDRQWSATSSAGPRKEEIAAAIEGSDAVVFAAVAGPGSGAERKLTMDRDGAIKLVRAGAYCSCCLCVTSW